MTKLTSKCFEKNYNLKFDTMFESKLQRVFNCPIQLRDFIYFQKKGL